MLVIICEKVFSLGGGSVYLLICLGITLLSLAGFTLAILSKKRKTALVGLISSIIAGLALTVFSFVLIPIFIENIEVEYFQLLTYCDRYDDNYIYSVCRMDAYPYDSFLDYYRNEKNAYSRVEDYLYGLQESGKYDKWVEACQFVYHTANRSALFNKKMSVNLWDSGYDVSWLDLQWYDDLLEKAEKNTFLVRYDGTNWISRLRKKIKTEIDYQNGKYVYVAPSTYSLKCRMNYYGILMLRTESDIWFNDMLVLDLNTGKGFWSKCIM